MIQFIAPLSQFEPSVLDLKDVTDEAVKRWGKQLELCVKSSSNPTTGKFYAYSPGWVPDPGNYRRSLWEPVGLRRTARPPGTTCSAAAPRSRSPRVCRWASACPRRSTPTWCCAALMWSYGASIQDANERVVLNSPETVAAVEFMARLFKDTMTNEVFSWNAASNNQGLVAGKLSYIVNSISA